LKSWLGRETRSPFYSVCISFSTSVPFRTTTVQVPNLALVETKRITVYMRGMHQRTLPGERCFFAFHSRYFSQNISDPYLRNICLAKQIFCPKHLSKKICDKRFLHTCRFCRLYFLENLTICKTKCEVFLIERWKLDQVHFL